jgi:hypothetical protein
MVTVSVVVSATIMVAVTEVPVSVAVPVMVMFKPAVISVPVTYKELISIVTRRHPAGPRVRWTSPIAFMPPVMSSHRIPITIHPHELGCRSWRQDANHTRRRWRSDSDSNGDLGAERGYAGQQHRGK